MNAQQGGFPPPESKPEPFNFESEKSEAIAELESKWMKKKLRLSKEQLAGVKGINSLYAFKRSEFESAMTSKDDGSRKKISDKLDQLDKEKDEELKKVLTQKQFEIYVKKKPELLQKIRTDDTDVINLPPPPPAGN